MYVMKGLFENGYNVTARRGDQRQVSDRVGPGPAEAHRGLHDADHGDALREVAPQLQRRGVDGLAQQAQPVGAAQHLLEQLARLRCTHTRESQPQRTKQWVTTWLVVFFTQCDRGENARVCIKTGTHPCANRGAQGS